MLLKSKRGSVTVFICIILSSVILLVSLFINVSASKASYSYSTEVLNLAGRSVLSEFDKELKDEYDIIAFYGETSKVEKKLKKYADYSIKNNRYMKIDNLNADLKEYSLTNTDIFREQVTEDGIAINNYKREGEAVSGNERVLRSSYILMNLPSYGADLETPGVKSLAGKIENHPDGEGLVRRGTKTALTNMYIMQHFNSGAFKVTDKDTFFNGEIEYILEGKESDEKNLKAVKSDLLILRGLINSIYLWADETKYAETLAAAELLTPGPEAVITQAVLIETWAAFEADNDVSILLNGGKVPLMKTDESWMTDLSTALDPDTEIRKGINEGYSYDDYLNLLLICLDDNSKYLRMMDLIQINLQGRYWEGFLINSMYTGFSFTADINGRKFEFDEKY